MTSARFSLLRHAPSVLVLVLLCSACAAPPVVQPEARPAPQPVEEPQVVAPPAPVTFTKAQKELASGVASYENGSYKLAARQLQNALALGLDLRTDQARAHKYLAFMHCVAGRERQCRDEFSKALKADPSFDLTPAESGHPTWGPVFRKLKAATK